MMPHEILEKVIYRDACMLVLNKPPGIAVHKGKGGGINMEQFFPLLRYGLPRVPALAHRLDKDTSGCLILGRHRQALADLGKMFQNNKVKKTYWAIVEGKPPQDEGVIDLAIGPKHDDDRNWHQMVRPDGLPAITEYKVLEVKGDQSWLELKPQTGRTHQLRVHMKALGCPIVGDKFYGYGREGDALHLHAQAVEIPFYKNKPPIIVTAQAPDYMKL